MTKEEKTPESIQEMFIFLFLLVLLLKKRNQNLSCNTQIPMKKKSNPSRSLFVNQEALSYILGSEIKNEEEFEIKDLWEDFGTKF